MTLTEYITTFKSAVSNKDWQQVALLDNALQAIVEAASVDMNSGADQQVKANQFECLLEELNALYTIASRGAISDRDALAVTITEASKSKEGTSCYQKMQQHR